jgi:hypothetical protein
MEILNIKFTANQDKGYLKRVGLFLKECHRRFYEVLPDGDPRQDVKFILDQQRKEILRYVLCSIHHGIPMVAGRTHGCWSGPRHQYRRRPHGAHASCSSN